MEILEQRMHKLTEDTKHLLVTRLNISAADLKKVLNLIEEYAMLYYEQGVQNERKNNLN